MFKNVSLKMEQSPVPCCFAWKRLQAAEVAGLEEGTEQA